MAKTTTKVKYNIGDVGPAGGYIIYDKKSYAGGWRYLEAAPADLRVVDGVPTVDANAEGYSSAPPTYCFGFFRKAAFEHNLYVNGTKSYSKDDCTRVEIKKGFQNTQTLVASMGNEAYSSIRGCNTTDQYAARLCAILKHINDGIVYDDWFLPSKMELLMMKCLIESRKGNFGKTYWSSSENGSDPTISWYVDFETKENKYDLMRSCRFRIRPVRMV